MRVHARRTLPLLLAVVSACGQVPGMFRQQGNQTATAPSIIEIRRDATNNTAFRRVLTTGRHGQVTVMHLAPGERIGLETHPEADQIQLVVAGKAEVIIDGQASSLRHGEMAFIPAGAAHDVAAAGSEPVKLIVIYAPPLHPAGEVEQTRPEEG